MLRPSPNHGTQRLPNDDDEQTALGMPVIPFPSERVFNSATLMCGHIVLTATRHFSKCISKIVVAKICRNHACHWRIQLGGCNPPLNFPKNSGHPHGHCDRFTCLAVVIDVVAASSNNVCLCAFAIE